MSHDDVCECGEKMRWDPDSEGTTCGGNRVRGAFVCGCGRKYIGPESRDAKSTEWRINDGGRSVDGDGSRIRVDGGDAVALMKRIVRLPELERMEAKMLAAKKKSKPRCSAVDEDEKPTCKKAAVMFDGDFGFCQEHRPR